MADKTTESVEQVSRLATYTVSHKGINQHGWFVVYCVNNKTGRTVEKSRKSVAELRRAGRITEKCICPNECDCQNPEPKKGVALISNECPIHNFNPAPSPDCPVHTGLTRD